MMLSTVRSTRALVLEAVGDAVAVWLAPLCGAAITNSRRHAKIVRLFMESSE